jgi:hypothetical protein
MTKKQRWKKQMKNPRYGKPKRCDPQWKKMTTYWSYEKMTTTMTSA